MCSCLLWPFMENVIKNNQKWCIIVTYNELLQWILLKSFCFALPVYIYVCLSFIISCLHNCGLIAFFNLFFQMNSFLILQAFNSFRNTFPLYTSGFIIYFAYGVWHSAERPTDEVANAPVAWVNGEVHIDEEQLSQSVRVTGGHVAYQNGHVTRDSYNTNERTALLSSL